MSAKKKAKKAAGVPLVFTKSYTPAPDSVNSFTLSFDKEPAIDSVRLRHRSGAWVIQQYCPRGVRYADIAFYGVAPYIAEQGWWDMATARTLWGIKRQWRKLYGTSRSFPSFTVWTSEVVT